MVKFDFGSGMVKKPSTDEVLITPKPNEDSISTLESKSTHKQVSKVSKKVDAQLAIAVEQLTQKVKYLETRNRELEKLQGYLLTHEDRQLLAAFEGISMKTRNEAIALALLRAELEDMRVNGPRKPKQERFRTPVRLEIMGAGDFFQWAWDHYRNTRVIIYEHHLTEAEAEALDGNPKSKAGRVLYNYLLFEEEGGA